MAKEGGGGALPSLTSHRSGLVWGIASLTELGGGGDPWWSDLFSTSVGDVWGEGWSPVSPLSSGPVAPWRGWRPPSAAVAADLCHGGRCLVDLVASSAAARP
jgi:hypothetical protein